MLCLTHAAVGAALGRLAGDPVDGFSAGLASHAVLDMIPHYDYRSTLAGVVDFLLAVLSASWFMLAAPDDGGAVQWGVLGAVLPDLEVAMAHLGLAGPDDLVFPSHSGLLPHRNVGLPTGLLTQALVLGLTLLSLGRPIGGGFLEAGKPMVL